MQKISMLLFLALFLMSCQPEEVEFIDLNLTVRTEIQDSKEKNDANRIRVRNIEALRKLPFSNTKTRKEVLVLGYYEPGDGGGGIFYWDPISTDEDNGGTILSPQDNKIGRWKREYKDTINVKWFGAKGNGITDDSDYIQNSINCIIKNGGGVIEFKKGESYLISKQFLLKSNTTIEGNGAVIFVDPRNWTGEITRFYSIFTTIDIYIRPQTILWRMGTGVSTFENIHIRGLKFQLNRNAHKLTTSEMDLSDFNAIRFEDARNCSINNCSFEDQQSKSNNIQTQIIFFVRCVNCSLTNCFFEGCTPIFIPESSECIIQDNTSKNSIGTAIETVGGLNHIVTGNEIHNVYGAVSVIGINSRNSVVKNNLIYEAALVGIVLGHDGPLSDFQYNLDPSSDFSICSNNIIKSGKNDASGQGGIGIIVQNGSNLIIEKNRIEFLVKTGSYTDLRGGIVLLGEGSPNRFDNILIKENYINMASSGIRVGDAKNLKVEKNYITNVTTGIYSSISRETPIIEIKDNVIISAERGVITANGYVNIIGNMFYNIEISNSLSNGYYKYLNNYHFDSAIVAFNWAKEIEILDNNFYFSKFTKNAVKVFNDNITGTASGDQILIYRNIFNSTYFTEVIKVNGLLDGYYETIGNSQEFF